MNKKPIIPFSLLCIFFFFGCKTPPAQKTIPTINQSVINVNKENIKIYFPEFSRYDSEKNKDVIQSGDCIIIILPDGKCMIVDSFVSTCSNPLVSFLKELGITKIDYLIATHYHSDHIGSMPALIKNFEIGSFYSNGADFDSDICRELHQSLESKNIQINQLKQGDSLVLSDSQIECKIDVFWPNLTDTDLYNLYYNPSKTQKMKNNSSLVFKLTYSDFSVLFTGDIYKQGDRQLVKEYGDSLKSTVLKVPHHGEFYTANSPEFVKTVSPEIAVIQDTRYVNYVISDIYRAVKSKLLYRDTSGYILIKSDGINYNVSETTFTETAH